jgi:hypothetical protein
MLVAFIDIGGLDLCGRAFEQHARAGRAESSCPRNSEENTMEVIVLKPVVALIAGILILILPQLLNYIVAVYLIVIGLVGLLNHLM